MTPDSPESKRHDPELGQMGADGIDHRGLLADEELACTVEHQAALLLPSWSRQTAWWP